MEGNTRFWHSKKPYLRAKQHSSSSGEIESTFWKDRPLYDKVVVLPLQNHIKHDTLCSLN